MLHCKEWSMPNDTEDEDRMAWSLATTLKEGLVVGARVPFREILTIGTPDTFIHQATMR
jgi:hypothetical protein